MRYLILILLLINCHPVSHIVVGNKKTNKNNILKFNNNADHNIITIITKYGNNNTNNRSTSDNATNNNSITIDKDVLATRGVNWLLHVSTYLI